jgi:L-ascorbate metabolism protein UlaG (beta-lactamase superfamily)
MQALTLMLTALLLTACGAPTYQGPKSDHFDGERFFNPERPQTNSFGTFLKWQFGLGEQVSQRATWPTYAAPRGAAEGGFAKPAARIEGTKLVVTAIGHASFLLQTQGLNILLDPVFEDRASPVQFAGPKRITPPGIPWADLPKIDAVLVSHNHYEHLSTATLAKLVARDNPLIVAPLNNESFMPKGARLMSKDWGETVELSPAVKVTLEPMQHWSARTPWDRRKALWAAMTIQTPAGDVYWVGDSGYGLGENAGTWFAEAGAKYPNIRLAILPIGAYEPRWFMQYSHMNPTEAVAAFQKTGATYGIGHHFGVFQLTDEAWQQPIDDLHVALEAAKISPTSFRALWAGEAWEIPLTAK